MLRMSEHGVTGSIEGFHPLGSDSNSDVRSINSARIMKYLREIYIERRIKEGATREQALKELHD
jgi:hypothetical protein